MDLTGFQCWHAPAVWFISQSNMVAVTQHPAGGQTRQACKQDVVLLSSLINRSVIAKSMNRYPGMLLSAMPGKVVLWLTLKPCA
jgi:hypothetical protein